MCIRDRNGGVKTVMFGVRDEFGSQYCGGAVRVVVCVAAWSSVRLSSGDQIWSRGDAKRDCHLSESASEVSPGAGW
eukprot:2225950-Prorocentrum_lima.AAC.1